MTIVSSVALHQLSSVEFNKAAQDEWRNSSGSGTHTHSLQRILANLPILQQPAPGAPQREVQHQLQNSLAAHQYALQQLQEAITLLSKREDQWLELLQRANIDRERELELFRKSQTDEFLYTLELARERAVTISANIQQIEQTLRELSSVPSLTNPTPTNPAASTVHLPKMDLKTFDGRLQDWPAFWDWYQSAIDSQPIPELQKLMYLKSCLKGSAATLIGAYALRTHAYTTVVDALKKRYERPEAIVNALYDELDHLPRAHQGTQLKAVHKVLCEALSEMTQTEEVNNFLRKLQIQWTFITPHVRWRGGPCERLIGLTKSALRPAIGRKLLSDAELATLCVKVEAIINSRPLTPLDDKKMISFVAVGHWQSSPTSVIVGAAQLFAFLTATIGNVRDNGTQLKAVHKVLCEALNEMIQMEEVNNFLRKLQTQWTFITPHARWKGGLYERLIGLTKSALRPAIGRKLLSDAELATLCVEVEAIINSRPLAPLDDSTTIALRPIDFLTPHANIVAPMPLPSDGSDPPSYAAAQHGSDPLYQPPCSQHELMDIWKKQSKHADKFWELWHSQYLSLLRVGEVVLVREDDLPRGCWPLAIVTNVSDSRRSATIRLPNGNYWERPVNALYQLELDAPGQVSAELDHIGSNRELQNEVSLGSRTARQLRLRRARWHSLVLSTIITLCLIIKVTTTTPQCVRQRSGLFVPLPQLEDCVEKKERNLANSVPRCLGHRT
uniref:Integrase catalytic domain-containing protein n=1 Tax=Ascaris lumbricoides TaxID=6252 RepID=A0A9J2P029_ASCLU